MLDQLTLFAEDTPASPFPQPGSDEARKMTATSGRNLVGSWLSYGPLGSLERTLLATSAWASMTCFLTWRDKVTPAGRLLFQLAPLARTTAATGAGLLPTPVTFYTRENWTPEKIAERQAEVKAATNAKNGPRTGNGFGLNLAQAHRFWHTPRANDSQKRGALAADDRSGLPAQVLHPQMFPTPNASDASKWSHQSLAERQAKGQQVRLNTAVSPEGGKGGSLNPAWVEWLMGFPEGWTDLKPSETP
jgi:hypothetical protein